MLRSRQAGKTGLIACLALVLGVAPALRGQQTAASSTAPASSQQKPAPAQQNIDQIGTTYDLLYGLGAAPSALQPSPFLVESVRQRKPGTALDIGSGMDGTASIWRRRAGR